MPDPEPDFLDPFDDAECLPARELFRRLGFEPRPPAALDDFQLPGHLWELIYAMAGRRIYLCHTDHVSDRALYTWLHDDWFEEETADIPFEAEWNCHVDVTDFGNGLDPIIWLRYFATEKERAEFATENNLKILPPHEDPPFDRDRWLPGMPPDDEDEDPFPFDDDEEQDSSDPLGLEKADAEIRAERRRQEQLAVNGSGEAEAWQRPIDSLRRAGAAPIPPEELTDETLPAKLWELLHNLACRGFYLLHTDHLGDRELYTALWQRGLRDDALLPAERSRTGGWFQDFIGSGSDEHTQLWLRFYARDEERAEHAKTNPEDPIPPNEKPPFNRDWRLPKGPF